MTNGLETRRPLRALCPPVFGRDAAVRRRAPGHCRIGAPATGLRVPGGTGAQGPATSGDQQHCPVWGHSIGLEAQALDSSTPWALPKNDFLRRRFGGARKQRPPRLGGGLPGGSTQSPSPLPWGRAPASPPGGPVPAPPGLVSGQVSAACTCQVEGRYAWPWSAVVLRGA